MKLKKIKNTLLVVLTLALVSVASVAITYALVENSLGSATNEFTNETISVQLSEVKWDGEMGPNDTDADVPADGQKGRDMAQSYSAGQSIPKNPKLSNTSDTSATATTDPQEWVAIKATYSATAVVGGVSTTYTYTNYADFLAATGAQVHSAVTAADGFNTTDWEAKDANNTVFYYKTKLDNRASTATLFDTIEMKALATESGKYKILDASGSEVLADALPTFEIKLEGFAVQADAVVYATAKTELDKLM
ncbi:MAG: hypothetical protein PUB37_08555 [Firmicutes bacterium]|nr:hypothetical protein [Bacillota bacterium]